MKKEFTEGKKESVQFFLFAGAKMEKTEVVMRFLVTALVEVWPKDEENYLFSREYYPVAWLGKLVDVEIFLRRHFCSAECLL